MKTGEDFCRTALYSVSDGVYFCDKDRRITYWNPGAEKITGYTAQEVTGICCADGLLAHVDTSGTVLCDVNCPLTTALTEGRTREAEVFLHHKEGHRVPVSIRTSPVYDASGNVEGAVEVFTDNSTLLAALKKVEQLSVEAETDPLTGVGNRRGMEAELGAYVAERRRSGTPVGVLFIDVDHFKEVNDVFGHETGDRVLKMVTRTLRHNLRASDSLARWGGDEFLALLHQVDLDTLRALAEKLRLLVARSYLTMPDGTRLEVTVSMGGTLLRPKESRRAVIARADLLLYESKTKGRNLVVLST